MFHMLLVIVWLPRKEMIMQVLCPLWPIGCYMTRVRQIFRRLLLTRYMTHNYFYHFIDCIFILLTASSAAQSSSHFLVFVLVPIICILIYRGVFFFNRYRNIGKLLWKLVTKAILNRKDNAVIQLLSNLQEWKHSATGLKTHVNHQDRRERPEISFTTHCMTQLLWCLTAFMTITTFRVT